MSYTQSRRRVRTLASLFGAALAMTSTGSVVTAPSTTAAPAPGSCDTSQRLVVCDYTTIGQYQLVVPFGVERLAVLANGGAGGQSASAPGGFGHQVTDYLEVEEGSLLFINVGGAATSGGCSDTRNQCQGGYGEGGFSSSGGGGGGASDIRTVSASQGGSQSSRLIVAGGGGGAGGSGSAAGGAGGSAGAAGAAGAGTSAGGGGGPGTQIGAGVGGSPNGTDGFLDKGGSNLGNGGAGAGGYFGGGSGGASAGGGGGGGGGSSLVAHDTGSVTTASQRDGQVQIRYAVEDHTAPVFTVQPGKPVEATSASGATVGYEASAIDDVDGAVAVACSPASGSVFRLGSTTVTCRATDVSGNAAQTSFDVEVIDTTPPSLSLPAEPIDEAATNRSGASVDYTATATDLVDGAITPDCRPFSGSTFSIGTTEVVCTARDSSGNLATGTFTVTVADRTAPVLTLPGDLTAPATGPSGTMVEFQGTATDAISQPVTVTCSPSSGSTFAIGSTTVTCTATDGVGNTSTGSFTVTVVDTTGPTLVLPANITVAATGSTGATVTYAATATDDIDGPRPVSCSTPSPSLFPVGITTVTCTSTDTRGNTSSGTFTVTVQPWRADLKVTVAGPATVTRGGTATYMVTVTNLGTSTATNVRTVLAASGLSVTATSPVTTSGSVKVQGVTYTGALWTAASLPAGGSVTYTLTGTVTAKRGETVVAQGATTSDVPDAVTTNNAARVTSTVPR